MKKMMSARYSTAAFNIATLSLRLSFGLLMFITHGLTKLDKFNEMKNVFFDPFHIGHQFSFILVLFSEVVCSLLLVIGLFTRLAAFVLFAEMLVVIFFYHKGQPVASLELAILHGAVYFSMLLIGPGKISVDGMAGK